MENTSENVLAKLSLETPRISLSSITDTVSGTIPNRSAYALDIYGYAWGRVSAQAELRIA